MSRWPAGKLPCSPRRITAEGRSPDMIETSVFAVARPVVA